MQQYRDRAQRIVDDVFADKERGGELRVVDEVGFRLPYELTCDLLGIRFAEPSLNEVYTRYFDEVRHAA